MSVPVVVNPATVSFAVEIGASGATAAVEVAGLSAGAAAGVAVVAVVVLAGGLIWWACSD